MKGIFQTLSSWKAGYRHVDLPEPWYKLAHAGRKQVLCVPDGPGSSILFWRDQLIIRLRRSPAHPVSFEQFAVRVTGICPLPSIRALLTLEGPETFPGMIRKSDAYEASLNQAISTQLSLFSREENDAVREWGIVAIRISPIDPIALGGARPKPSERMRQDRIKWMVRPSAEL